MKQIIPSLQWLMFILSGSIVVPITLASSFGLGPEETMGFISRTFIVLALSGLLQVLFGHRMPIHEGPAGLWWGFFSLYASLGAALYGSADETLRVLEFSLLVSGIFTIVLGVSGLLAKLARFFTPYVVGIYMILLVAQLSGSFLKGLLGIDLEGKVSPTILLISIAIIVLSIIMTRHKMLNSFNIIACIIVGWGLFSLFGYTPDRLTTDHLFAVPQLFAFGLPRIDWSIIPTVIFVTLLLITNMLATIKLVENVLKRAGETEIGWSPKKSGFFMGLSQILGGLLAAVGSVPISGAAGFIAVNKITSRIPFIIASCLILVLSFFSPVVSLVAALPPAVGYAAIFPIFAGMLGLGLRELLTDKRLEETISRAGLPLFSGLGVMVVPAEMFASLPPFLTSLLSNGLVLGTVIALGMETFRVARNHEKTP